MTQKELEKYLWGAATALRGTIDAGDYKQYIFPLLFFKRISDAMLTNLIEHFSAHKLNLANVPGDQLGNAYEYLIKEFADDSGHTAAEFYTNRTVVKLMTMIMDPQPGESVYDPAGARRDQT